MWFLALAIIFLGLECLVPLRDAIKIGADEDFELSKTFLYLKGFHFYSEVWNDEPPFYPYLLGQVLQYFSFSLLAARLLTVGFALVLFAALFRLGLSLGNLRIAVLSVAFLILSPGFLQLASSCMVEIPSVACVVTAFALLSWPKKTSWPLPEISAGIFFGIALQLKVIAVIYLPLTVLILWLNHRPTIKQLLLSLLIMGGMAGICFVMLNALTGCSLGLQFQTAWTAHFSGTRSFEYGSPATHVFDWSLLLKNWDAVIPVILGMAFVLPRIRSRSPILFPLAWLVLTLAIVSTHKPWWTNYYLHNAVPLCFCAALAMDAALRRASQRKLWMAILMIYILAAGTWMGMRGYLQIVSMRGAPRVFSSLVLTEINRYKPFTKFLYAGEGVYSFHAGIPLPPQLADISLKRLWSGDMTNAKLAAELARIKPGMILTANQTLELPYQELLQSDYQLVYQDNDHQLYALKSIIPLADP